MLELLRCPISGQSLHPDREHDPQSLTSADGQHVYPIVNGIPHMVATARITKNSRDTTSEPADTDASD